MPSLACWVCCNLQACIPSFGQVIKLSPLLSYFALAQLPLTDILRALTLWRPAANLSDCCTQRATKRFHKYHPERSLIRKLFELAGASAGYFLRNRALQGSTRQLGNLALIVGFNFFLGSSSGSMIDNSGHLGGLGVGLLLSLGMAPSWDIVSAVLPIPLSQARIWPGLSNIHDYERMPASLTPQHHDCSASASAAPLIMSTLLPILVALSCPDCREK